jgi:hypothetical protein
MLRRALGWLHSRTRVAPGPQGATALKILVVGVYLRDRPNTVEHLVAAFGSSERHRATQRWIAIGDGGASKAVSAVTVEHLSAPAPKFTLINRLLEGWRAFDYLLVCDDDIRVPRGFLDAFLSYQVACDFALAQPARTRTSHADRKFVRAVRGLRARRTRFVEIGPLFSLRTDLAARLLPFDESSPMGWGYDFVWPVIAESAGLRLGVVDATPVDHSLRSQASAYSKEQASRDMVAYLNRHPHLEKRDAFSVLETW